MFRILSTSVWVSGDSAQRAWAVGVRLHRLHHPRRLCCRLPASHCVPTFSSLCGPQWGLGTVPTELKKLGVQPFQCLTFFHVSNFPHN